MVAYKQESYLNETVSRLSQERTGKLVMQMAQIDTPLVWLAPHPCRYRPSLEMLAWQDARDSPSQPEYLQQPRPGRDIALHSCRPGKVAKSNQRLAAVRTRMDRIYEDKLDGKIDDDFWTRKMSEYRGQEGTLETALSSLRAPVTEEHVLTVERIFELANKAHFLYLTRDSAERGQLLKSVLLNCATDGVSLWPTYRKPFDLIFQRAKNEIGRGERI